ncbi:putative biofilm formation methyltransferase WspC [Sporomusa ovata DSM 2662]|uniref:protein-glutamate O-methyltransferase n=1 Tax=Sporomusa ovata TaxID=2378 RepID=A0A0U1KTI3_9FIRM|nr:protein-glutamate O-methyltransferase CheR [Sporomusa ovata]EQB26639.1 chemotaxis protein methyltransferase [Sporomusa ovata DSM 2662]CQR70731.1 Chemotaxis protein methyltransferase CheR [Sporomusa ovata]
MITKTTILPTPDLEKLSLLINQRYGLEFRRQRLKLLQAAIQERMKVCKISTINEYLQLVQQQEEELLRLINLLTVHETYFFREPTHLTIMSKQAIPELLENRRQTPFLRLLSAGCSTGEEAYSMAIAALTIPGAGIDWDFEVIGVDVDKEAIKKAQAGIYGLYSFRSCPRDIHENCFDRVAKESFMIKSHIKKKVRFEPLNLFAQVYPDWTQNMDIIFYRNVSIYFSEEQQKEVFRRLSELLTPDGCLFLSCTETLYHNNELLSLVKNDDVFYYQKQAAKTFTGRAAVTREITAINKQCLADGQTRQIPALQLKKQIPKLILQTNRSSVTTRKRQSPLPLAGKDTRCQEQFTAALELVKFKKYPEAISRLDEVLAVDSFYIKAYTLKANILLNLQCVDTAIELCQTALMLDTFCLEAYLLLGMAAKLAGQQALAIQHFKEAVYVYPECWLAHFYLAEMYQLPEEAPYAKREYKLAMKLLKQGNFEKHGLSFFLMPFQLDDFIQLCQHNIAKLQAYDH